MLKHIIGFVLFVVCFVLGFVSGHEPKTPEVTVYNIITPTGSGVGASAPEPGSGCPGCAREELPGKPGLSTPLKILAKPKAVYTEEAKNDAIEGSVLLKVTFLANGQVGGISVVKPLGDGLTDVSVEAARQLKFEPARVDGIPQTVTKSVEYTFSLY